MHYISKPSFKVVIIQIDLHCVMIWTSIVGIELIESVWMYIFIFIFFLLIKSIQNHSKKKNIKKNKLTQSAGVRKVCIITRLIRKLGSFSTI